jgi:hypothetical protein
MLYLGELNIELFHTFGLEHLSSLENALMTRHGQYNAHREVHQRIGWDIAVVTVSSYPNVQASVL